MAAETDAGAAFSWEPTSRVKEDANITRFMRGVGVATLEDLWAFAHRDIRGFYDSLIGHLGLAWLEPYHEVLDLARRSVRSLVRRRHV